MASVTDLLDRRFAYLTGIDDAADFLRHLHVYLDELVAHPSSARVARALVAEAEQAVANFHAHELALMDRAVELRTMLVKSVPEIDNSNVAEPTEIRAWAAWTMDGLGSFDRLAASREQRPDRLPALLLGEDNTTPLSTMLLILRSRREAIHYDGAALASANDLLGRLYIDRFDREIKSIVEAHDAARAEFDNVHWTSAGAAYMRVEAIARMLQPEVTATRKKTKDDELTRRISRVLTALVAADWGKQPRLDIRSLEYETLEKRVVYLEGRAQLERLHVEVVHRIEARIDEPRMHRILLGIGRGSYKAAAFVLGVVVTTVITVILTIYLTGWLTDAA